MKEQKLRIHRSKIDYGVNDYYRDFKKNNKQTIITRKIYGDVVKDFNSFLRDNLAVRGREIILPNKMGRIELRKTKTEVKIAEDGSIKNNMAINWKETIKLWNESPQSKEKKTKIRFTNEHTNSYTFRVSYFKARADYKNKSIYSIKFNRTLRRTLSTSIFKGNIDAFVNEY